MKRFLLVLALLASSTAFALPTVEQVQAEVKQGHYAQAETMMGEVVAAKPGSARAHYIYAEILAHDAKFYLASQQAQMAQQIDPAIGFTEPAKFRAFQDLLQREQQAQAAGRSARQATPAQVPAAMVPRQQASASSGVPGWVWIAGIAVVALLLWRMARRAGAPAMRPSPMGGGYAQPGPYAPQPYGAPPAAGSGLLGAGLAAAGGVAAGMLAERMIEGHRHPDQPLDDGTAWRPGSFDDPAANALESRDVDFGGGGGGWDSGGGGSIDAGSSGGGDDWS